MEAFAREMEEESKNVSFSAYFAAGNVNKCIDILLEVGRAPEAAMMARSYAPRRMDECARAWRQLLVEKGYKKIAESIALPSSYPQRFEEWLEAEAEATKSVVEEAVVPEQSAEEAAVTEQSVEEVVEEAAVPEQSAEEVVDEAEQEDNGSEEGSPILDE
jgi:coatomer subunit beta'